MFVCMFVFFCCMLQRDLETHCHKPVNNLWGCRANDDLSLNAAVLRHNAWNVNEAGVTIYGLTSECVNEHWQVRLGEITSLQTSPVTHAENSEDSSVCVVVMMGNAIWLSCMKYSAHAKTQRSEVCDVQQENDLKITQLVACLCLWFITTS